MLLSSDKSMIIIMIMIMVIIKIMIMIMIIIIIMNFLDSNLQTKGAMTYFTL